MNPKHAAAVAALLTIAGAPQAQQATRATLDVARPDVQSFVAQMRREHGFDAQETVWILRDAVPQPRIVEIMERPAESALPWWEYRERFHASVNALDTRRPMMSMGPPGENGISRRTGLDG